MTDTLLEQGISAARSGQRGTARNMLLQVVQTDAHNEEAWIWLAGMVDEPEEMRTCLENVLHLNPSNLKAQQGLAWVEQRYGPRPVVAQTPVPEPTPVLGPTPVPEPAPQPAPQSAAAILAMLEQHAQPSQVAETAPAILPSGSATYRSLHERPIASASDPQAELPCLYCGAAMQLKQKRCPACDKSQMYRADPEPHKGSKAMTFLACCWLIPAVVGYIAFIVTILIGLVEGPSSGAASRPNLLFVIISVILTSLIYLLLWSPFLLLARGLYRCRRVPFIIQCIWTGIEMLVCCLVLLTTIRTPGGLGVLFNNGNAQRSAVLASAAFFWLLVAYLVGWRLLIFVLLWFGHGAVYGRRTRMLPQVKVSSANYNNGLDYRQRGMWYMAVQEWEGAVLGDPRELEYLHTLGLGYAQLKLFDRARTMLDSALKLAPNDTRIADSRALVVQLEQGQIKW